MQNKKVMQENCGKGWNRNKMEKKCDKSEGVEMVSKVLYGIRKMFTD